MEKKVQNLLNFSDFEKNWRSKEYKKTKRTEVGLDIFEKKFVDDEDDLELDNDELLDSEEEDLDTEDWKEQLLSTIDDIISDGVEADDIFDYIDDIKGDHLNDDDDDDEVDLDGEDIDLDDDDVDFDEDDDDSCEDCDDDVLDDEEGVQERFRRWRR